MILLFAQLSIADPVALRAPVDGDLVVSLGAPTVGAAVRLPAREGAPVVALGAGLRWPAGTAELGAALSHHHGPDEGWRVGYGLAVGGLFGPALPFGLSVSPWARLERRGAIDGGVQLALPVAVDLQRSQSRWPVVVEPFLGGRIGRVHLSAQGGAGWVWSGDGGAGALYAQGSVHLGLPLPGDKREP
ncbi:MAG: hypothetical protein EA397_02020 [Deltaproteobacteria bacterium]|nr:MAG: hypothetical protein EA397_02020 [Deltaproteobacteria bacterium]